MNKPIDITKKVGRKQISLKDLKNKFIFLEIKLRKNTYYKRTLICFMFYVVSENNIITLIINPEYTTYLKPTNYDFISLEYYYNTKYIIKIL